MRILADENIPYVAEAFGQLGTVKTISGRKMTRDLLAQTDALLVRSITPVNEKLLAGTPVRFVGTATIGFDHVDTAYLKQQDITFATAAGSNANSVAEYITASLLVLAARFNMSLSGKTLGVVGYGNVGTKVVRYACQVLRMNVLVCDPPLQREGSLPVDFVSLDELLAQSDAVTCHVPLTKTGPDFTHNLIDTSRISIMKNGAFLLNSSRGSVVVGRDLGAALTAGKLLAAVLDVWENEPTIDPALLRQVALGTPHIAGYSFDGKIAGTQMLYDALCARYNIVDKPVEWSELVPAPADPHITFAPTGNDQADLLAVLSRIYDVQADDARLRTLADLPVDQQGPHFDKLRKEYPTRREAWNYSVSITAEAPSLAAKLAALGFTMM